MDNFKNASSRNCATCLFWDRKDNAKDYHPQECRRYPPALRNSTVDPKAWFAAFPETFGDSWCGCWKQREGRDQKTKKVWPKTRKARTDDDMEVASFGSAKERRAAIAKHLKNLRKAESCIIT